MKVGIFLILLGVVLGVERVMLLKTELSTGIASSATVLTMVLYTSIPIYFGIRGVLRARGAR